MARKHLISRLPFEEVKATPRVGRPRVPRVIVHCSDCGAPIERRITDVERARAQGVRRAFCSQCYARFRTRGVRPRGTNTKIRTLDRTHNGRPVFLDHHGYIAIFEPTFSLAQRRSSLPKGYHYEHTVVAARAIGRAIRRGEHVHHINGIKTDNRAKNLQVVTQKRHRQIHNDEIAAKLARLDALEQRVRELEARTVTHPAVDRVERFKSRLQRDLRVH